MEFYEYTNEKMPKESVKNRIFKDIFKGNVQFEIPFFQRGYVWDTPQWKALFDDILEQIINELDESKNFDDTEHFFGPVVVLEKTSDDPNLKRFLIIDGQQRITTIYLMLATIRDLFKKRTNDSDFATEKELFLKNLLINDLEPNGNDYKLLKVYSVKGDRIATYNSVVGGKQPSSPTLNMDLRNYDYPKNKIDKLKKYFSKSGKLGNFSLESLWDFTQAILNSLKIVWIPLDDKKDDPQAIFESLNAKGTALSASDLLCNYIFRPYQNDSQEYVDRIHENKWLKVKRSISNDYFEDFLRHLYSIGQSKMLGKGNQLYISFKKEHKYLTKNIASNELDKIEKFSLFYNNITNPIAHKHPNDEIGKLLEKLNTTRITQIYPFLMFLLDKYENRNLDKTDLISLLKETLTLLVRRKISGETRQFNVLFPSLGDKIIYDTNKVEVFQQILKDNGLWVSDSQFVNALINSNLYIQTERVFAKYILTEIDKKMTPYNEYPDYGLIDTIEHIMPQNYSSWKEYLGQKYHKELIDSYLNTLGNLALKSRNANSALSNNSFKEKIKIYKASNSTKLINDVIDRNFSNPQIVWDTDSIKERSKDLAKLACKIWKWS